MDARTTGAYASSVSLAKAVNGCNARPTKIRLDQTNFKADQIQPQRRSLDMRIRTVLPSFVLPLCLLGLLLGMSPIRSGAPSQGQDEVTVAQFAAALESQKQSDAKLTRGESAERRFQELSAKLQRTGSVRIIVQLRVAFRPEGAARLHQTGAGRTFEWRSNS